ncbi:hypothetical protein D3C86_1808300 [compost metagenome]
MAPQARLPAVIAPLNTVRYTASERPRTQLGRMDCATPLSVVSAVIQAAPSTSRAASATHCGGAQASTTMTSAASSAESSSRPSALSRARSRGMTSAPPIAPRPTAPSRMP